MIELNQAWSWECPLCGEKNYDDSVEVEFDNDEAEVLLYEHGINVDDNVCLTAPEVVTCKECFEEFPARDENCDED